MQIKELFGRTITRIFADFGVQDDWLDTADCFIELDSALVIGFPFSPGEEVWMREIPETAEQLFQEGEPNLVIGRKIIDFIWYDDADYGGYFLLDDGMLITETRMSPQGTGQAGLNAYASLQDLAQRQSSSFNRLT